MTGYAVLAALVFLFTSDALYRKVVARATSLLPLSMQTETTASFALGAVIWDRKIPNELRRKYLLSIGFAAMAGLCVTVVAYDTGHPNWAAFFACLLLGVIGHGLRSCMRYRALA